MPAKYPKERVKRVTAVIPPLVSHHVEVNEETKALLDHISEPTVMAVDPGQHGGFALIGYSKKIYLADKLPYDNKGVFDWSLWGSRLNWLSARMREYGDTELIVEKQWSRPGQSSKSTFTHGFNYGQLLATIMMRNMSFLEVLPTGWSTLVKDEDPPFFVDPYRDQHGNKDNEDKKARNIWVARKLFGDEIIDKWFGDLNKQFCTGVCDAILIAEWARRLRTGIKGAI